MELKAAKKKNRIARPHQPTKGNKKKRRSMHSKVRKTTGVKVMVKMSQPQGLGGRDREEVDNKTTFKVKNYLKEGYKGNSTRFVRKQLTKTAG